MNEDEAKTKICPHARYFDPGNGDAPRCCASACMAWRWEPVKDKRAYEGSASHMKPGYCGLAGAPQ